MPAGWRQSETAPLVRLVMTFGIVTAVVMTVVAVRMITQSVPQRDVPVATSLGDAATELTAARSGAAPAAPPPPPTWIWSTAAAEAGQRAVLRRVIEFDAPPERVLLHLSCDNHGTVVVDDRVVGESGDWAAPVELDLTPFVTGPSLAIEIRARNDAGAAGVLAIIEITTPDRPGRLVVTDSAWHAGDTGAPAVEIGPHGVPPWGELPGFGAGRIDRAVRAPDGFEVELVYEVPRHQGSWVSLTTDGTGRLVASAQSSGLFRITPGARPAETVVESIESPVGAAQGLLCLDGDLYCVVAGPRAEGEGLYRLRDTDGDDRYDETRLLRRLDSGGEHGPHAVVAGPDDRLYVVAGNHTALPDPERSVVPRNWDEDQLLPRLWDPRGHAVGITAPGGWICRTDRDGSTWELFAIGFRNVYDIAFDRDGELFAFDADMEWDMGAPWYRPTRINHVTSGAEFGWRSGTGKWPPSARDSLPAAVDIGPGSPTGVCFGYDTSFPPRYRDALFALDWTFGTIYAVHLEPSGATYRGVAEPFVTGRPLPVADIVASPHDGALYFVVGGRGVPSALYRVRYAGPERPSGAASQARSPAREERRRLEAMHRPHESEAVIDEIWPHLGDDDRFVAYAARVALEHQPVAGWADRVAAEPDARARLHAVLALARRGGPGDRPRVVRALEELDPGALGRDERLIWLRGWKLCFTRLGRPDGPAARRVAGLLEPLYPAHDDLVDRELCDLLVYLESPTVVARTIPLMERPDASAPSVDPDLLSRNDTYGSAILKMAAASPQRQAVHLALALSSAGRGWTPALRDRYFRWFEDARRTSGGMSFSGFLDGIRQRALERVPERWRDRYASIDADAPGPERADGDWPGPEGPGRSWTVEELTALAAEELGDRDFARGQRMYAAGLCAQCHRFAGTGVAGGPDLTAVATRFTVRDLLEAIVEPSRMVSDQYEQTEILLDDDTIVLGRVIGRDDRTVRVLPSMLLPELVTEIDAARVIREAPSRVSPMMPGLVNRMNADEVLDLLAYLLSEGDARDPIFNAAAAAPPR